MSRFARLIPGLLCVAMVGGFAGCTTFHIPFAKTIPKATAAEPVVQILCLWQQSEGVDPEGVPCRGFAGQILFLSNRGTTTAPVQVEGKVRIYLFDDLGTVDEQSKPLRQFDFDDGSWGIHLAETSLGPTYHVFIPYVRRGTTEANCALRVRLTPKDGPVVFSNLSNLPLTLNTKPVSGEDAKKFEPEEVETTAAGIKAEQIRRTLTIPMGSDPSKPKATQPNSGQVQFASHEVVEKAPNQSDGGERIERLENTLQLLIEQMSKSANAPAAPAQIRRDQRRMDVDLESDTIEEPSERIRLPRRAAVRNNVASEPTRDAPRRRVHPLELDEAEASQSSDEDNNVLHRSSAARY